MVAVNQAGKVVGSIVDGDGISERLVVLVELYVVVFRAGSRVPGSDSVFLSSPQSLCRGCSFLFTLFSPALPSRFISLSWSSTSDILSSAWSIRLLILVHASRSSRVAFFSSINSLIFLSILSILVSISSNLFSRFLVSWHLVRTCSLSSQKFLTTHLLNSDSVISSHSFSIQPCSLAGEELWSLLGGEVFWFRVFSSFLRRFLPIFKDLSTCRLCSCWLSDWVSNLSDWRSVCWWWGYFCFLVFLLTVWPPCCRSAEVHSRPCLPGVHLQQLLSSKGCYQFSSSAIFVPEGYPPSVNLISLLWGVFLDI